MKHLRYMIRFQRNRADSELVMLKERIEQDEAALARARQEQIHLEGCIAECDAWLAANPELDA